MRHLLLACAFGVAASPVAGTVSAQTLGFFPQRVVMEGRERSAVLRLTNKGQVEASYRIELLDMIYQADGRIIPSMEPPRGFPSAKPYIKFSPRQVRLKPGQSQTVRILFRGRNVREGEYRVHAVLRKLPNTQAASKTRATGGRIASQIGVAKAVALPVIVRRGQTSAEGRIQRLTLTGGKRAVVDILIGRAGNRSLYTQLVLKSGTGEAVAVVKGVAVPVPNRSRRFRFHVRDRSAASLKSGGYSLELIDQESGETLDVKALR